MDHLRQIRFVIGPFFYLGNLLLGAVFGCSPLVDKLWNLDTPRIVAIATMIGAAVLPLGYLIGAVSVLMQRVIFLLAKSRPEAHFSSAIWDGIWAALETHERRTWRNGMYGAVTFELEKFSNGIISWIDRRWNAYNASVNSFVGLCLALATAPALHIRIDGYWIVISMAFAVLLLISAACSWRETMAMIAFQVSRPLKTDP